MMLNNTTNKERDTLIWLMGVLDSISDKDELTGPLPSGNEDPFIKIPRKTFDRIRRKIMEDLNGTVNDNKTLLRG